MADVVKTTPRSCAFAGKTLPPATAHQEADGATAPTRPVAGQSPRFTPSESTRQSSMAANWLRPHKAMRRAPGSESYSLIIYLLGARLSLGAHRCRGDVGYGVGRDIREAIGIPGDMRLNFNISVHKHTRGERRLPRRAVDNFPLYP